MQRLIKKNYYLVHPYQNVIDLEFNILNKVFTYHRDEKLKYIEGKIKNDTKMEQANCIKFSRALNILFSSSSFLN